MLSTKVKSIWVNVNGLKLIVIPQGTQVHQSSLSMEEEWTRLNYPGTGSLKTCPIKLKFMP
ncbi:hypothetical protein GCM10008968_25670 [Bacillus horti]